MRRAVAFVAIVLGLAVLALAHGAEKHIMGTVTRISGSSITLETMAKKSLTVGISEKTKFEKSGSAATLRDLKAGERVVIEADQDDDKLTAIEVRFGAMKPKSSMEGMQGMDHMHGGAQPHDHQ